MVRVRMKCLPSVLIDFQTEASQNVSEDPVGSFSFINIVDLLSPKRRREGDSESQCQSIIILAKQSSGPIREARPSIRQATIIRNDGKSRSPAAGGIFHTQKGRALLWGLGSHGQAPNHTVLEGPFPGRSRGSSPAERGTSQLLSVEPQRWAQGRSCQNSQQAAMPVGSGASFVTRSRAALMNQ